MKKITESQLKDRVNSLREYLKVYEDDIPFDPTWGGTKAPADTRNFWQRNAPNFLGGQDAPQAANKNATWNNAQQAAVSNQPKAPVDLANMDIGFGPGKFAPDDANQAASVTPAAPSTQDLTAAASASGEAVGKSLQQFKELLAKAALPAAPLPPGEKRTQAEIDHAKSLGSFAVESTTYFLNKLRLIESRQLNEALTPEEEKQLDTLAQSYGDSEDPEIAGLMKQYSDYKNSKLNAQPAQAAAVTPAAPAVRPPVAVDPRDGPVGQALAKLGVSKKDRLDQAFVDSTLGAGKYKAGTAESNMALQAHFKKQGGGQGASVTAVTPPTKPTAPELTQTQQNLKNNGYAIPGTEMRSPAEIAASASLADATPNINAGLTPDDPRFTNPDGTKGPKAPPAQAASVTPKKNFKPYPAGSRYDKEDKAKAATNPALVATESVGYNELQRIVSLVNHR